MKTVELIPTWRGLLPAMLTVYTDADAEGRRTALTELARMAQLADRYVELMNRAKDVPEDEYGQLLALELSGVSFDPRRSP